MKKANPTAVGAFALGAIAIAIGTVVVFGSGRFFQERERLISFFPGSLQGLRVGAPVEMRGVQLGTVTDILIEFDPDELKFTLPVIMEIDLSRIRVAQEDQAEYEERDYGDILIAQGLRAQLAVQSLVTGQQTIQVDFFPGTPVNLKGGDWPYEELPTVPSKIEEIETSIGTLLNRAGVALEEFRLLLSVENRQAIADMLQNVAGATGNLDPLHDEVIATLKTIGGVATRAENILASNENEIAEAIKGLREVEAALVETANAANTMLEENRKGMRDFSSRGLYEITNLAVDAQATVEQIRVVMEKMERDPARFFLGTQGEVEVR